MEKRKAHYSLSRVKELIRDGNYQVTRTALRCATRDFGITQVGQVAACVLDLEVRDLYKSMTTLHDATLWQDVYRPNIEGVPAYVKIQVMEDTTVVISFKALEGD